MNSPKGIKSIAPDKAEYKQQESKRYNGEVFFLY